MQVVVGMQVVLGMQVLGVLVVPLPASLAALALLTPALILVAGSKRSQRHLHWIELHWIELHWEG